MSWLMLLAVGVAALTLVGGRFVFYENRRIQVLDRRLTRVRARTRAAWDEPEQRQKKDASGGLLNSLWTGGLHTFWTDAMALAAMLVPVGAEERAKLRELIVRAGFLHPDALSIFMTIKLIMTLAFGVLVGLWAARGEWLGDYAALIVLAGLAGAVVGGIAPEIGLRSLVTRRYNRLVAALPDALDLLTLCVESGLTFERSLDRVVQELRPLAPDIAREMAVLEAELRLGADRKNALHDFYTRTKVEGLRNLATTLIQGERYGTPLVQSMKNIARSERMQRATRIAAQIERLPVLMALPTLLLVMPGMVMLVAGPAFLLTMEALRNIGG